MSYLEMAIERARVLDRAADAPAWIAVELLVEVDRLRVVEKSMLAKLEQDRVRAAQYRERARFAAGGIAL